MVTSRSTVKPRRVREYRLGTACALQLERDGLLGRRVPNWRLILIANAIGNLLLDEKRRWRRRVVRP